MYALLRQSQSSLLQRIARSAPTPLSTVGTLETAAAAFSSTQPAFSSAFHSLNVASPPQSLLSWWSQTQVQHDAGRRGYATEEEPAAAAAELNPLLQTPAPPSSRAGEPSSAGTSGRVDPRARDPSTSRAVLHGISMSPKKLALWTDLVRRRHVDDALVQCRMSPKKSAKICLKVLQSAQANAVHNHGLDGARLLVDLIHVGHGTHRKEVWPHGRGRAGVRRHYQSNLTVVLRETESQPRTHFQEPMMVRPRKFA